MVIFPACSFIMSAYMLVSYWMDAEGWTMLRRCLMFANVPMVIFFGAPARKPATAASLRRAVPSWRPPRAQV